VISPLLSNLYLHELDRAWHAPRGPRSRYNARLVRYADDFVVLARAIGEPIQQFLTDTLEGRLGLTLNRDKTRIVDLRVAKASLDFLGYTFRYDRDLTGGPKKYLNLFPSAKAVKKMGEQVRQMTTTRCKMPIPLLIQKLNRRLRGWGNYFSIGYPSQAYKDVNWYVGYRIARNLKRRSQRRCRKLDGKSLYESLARAGLYRLSTGRADNLLCMPMARGHRKAGCGKTARPV
jgi:RNA-directed DNA polymerase